MSKTKKSSNSGAAKVNSGGTPTPRPRAVRVGPLASLGNVAEEASRLYRAARQGRIRAADAAKLAFVLNVVRGALETATLEARIERLEALETTNDRQDRQPHFSA